MNRPLLSDPVIYTDPTGVRRAAIVASDRLSDTGNPALESTERDLVVFWFNGQAAFPVRAVPFSLTDSGCWSWPR